MTSRLPGKVLNMQRFFSDNVTRKDRVGYLDNALRRGVEAPISH